MASGLGEALEAKGFHHNPLGRSPSLNRRSLADTEQLRKGSHGVLHRSPSPHPHRVPLLFLSASLSWAPGLGLALPQPALLCPPVPRDVCSTVRQAVPAPDTFCVSFAYFLPLLFLK